MPRKSTEIAGIDFGLKDFLVISDGRRIQATEPFKKTLKKLRQASKNSARRSLAAAIGGRRKTLARIHQAVANQRKDFHFKLALELVRSYRNIAIEDLNLQGMKALWGRKVSDLGFAPFVHTLEFQAMKNSAKVVKIDRWNPSSEVCNVCQYYQP